MKLDKIHDNIYRFSDVCNCYLIKHDDLGLLIDCGNGEIKNYLGNVGVKKIEWIVHTHAHRDLSQGDHVFIEKGAKIAIGAKSEKYYRAQTYWTDLRTYEGVFEGYKTGFFAPIRDIHINKKLTVSKPFVWHSFEFEILATPGHSDHDISLLLRHKGKTLLFSGDLIAAPGKIWELWSVAGSYEDFGKGCPPKRIKELSTSLEKIKAIHPDIIMPAHGNPFDHCELGIETLITKLNVMAKEVKENKRFKKIEPPTKRIKLIRNSSLSFLILADNGHAVMIDAGYKGKNEEKNILDKIKEIPSLKTVDIIIPTHCHNDHIATMSSIAESYDAKVYCMDLLKDMLEKPTEFFLTCGSPFPIKVDRVFKEGQSFIWNDLTFTFYHFPGQTYWHQAVFVEIEGHKILFTGDCLKGPSMIRYLDPWNYVPISQPVNGMKCIQVLEHLEPHYLGVGHWKNGIVKWNPKNIPVLYNHWNNRTAILTDLIAEEAVDMGYDPNWARIQPARTVVSKEKKIVLQAVIRNHFSRDVDLEITLDVPQGWSFIPKTIARSIKAYAESVFEIQVAIPKKVEKRRYVIGLNVVLNNIDYGLKGVGFVDIGQSHSYVLRNMEEFKHFFIDV